MIHKGDVEFGGYVGTNGNDLHGAFAISNNFGLTINGSHADTHSDSSDRYRKHLYGEAGFGYTRILTSEISDGEDVVPIFTCFGGFGLGKAEGLTQFSNIFNNNLKYTNISKGNFLKFYLNPSIGWTSDIVEFYINTKINYVQFTKLENHLQADWQNAIEEDGFKYNVYYEPTLTLRAGSEVIKGSLQAGLSIGHYPDDHTAFRGRPLIIILGLHFNFNKK